VVFAIVLIYRTRTRNATNKNRFQNDLDRSNSSNQFRVLSNDANGDSIGLVTDYEPRLIAYFDEQITAMANKGLFSTVVRNYIKNANNAPVIIPRNEFKRISKAFAKGKDIKVNFAYQHRLGYSAYFRW
jgi:hypothetical protein